MLKSYFKLFRIPQWIKNFFVLVPLIFSKNLFHGDYFVTVLFGFLLFCLTSSVVYVINDIIDVEADRAHPIKKSRPLASGAISKRNALVSVYIIAIIISVSLTKFDYHFAVVLFLYFILNVFYSFYFKHIVILDVFSIAAGFMLRVLGGAFIIHVEISSWLILTTMFISLFL